MKRGEKDLAYDRPENSESAPTRRRKPKDLKKNALHSWKGSVAEVIRQRTPTALVRHKRSVYEKGI